MRRYNAAILFLISLLCASSLQAFSLSDLFRSAPKENPQQIRVLLLDQVPSAMLTVHGAYNIYDPASGAKLGSYFSAKRQLLRPLGDGLVWGEGFPGTYQIQVRPDTLETALTVDDVHLFGDVAIYQVDGLVSVVATIDVEQYVTALLARGFDERMDAEVLAALAITERTKAYYSALNGKSRFWDVDAREVGYIGYNSAQYNPAVEDAVNMTRRLVMLNSDGGARPKVFAAEWTENSAGKTASYHLIHRQYADAPTQGVECPFSGNERSLSRWTTTVSKFELAQLAKMDDISKIHLLRDASSSKVFAVRFEDRGYSKEVDYLAMRRYLGSDVLRSSDFTMTVDGDLVRISGHGAGDGVGVCLTGAQRMAERGADARRILQSYYPTAYLELVPPEGLQTQRALAEGAHEGYRRYAR